MTSRWIRHLLEHKLPHVSGSAARTVGRAARRLGNGWTALRDVGSVEPIRTLGLLALVAVGAALWLTIDDRAPASAPAPAVSTPVTTTAPTTTARLTPVPTPVPTPIPQGERPSAKPGIGERSHTVVRGDTLASIALRVRVPFEHIAQVNKIANPNRITVGQRLTITPRPTGMEMIDKGATMAGLAKKFGGSTTTLVTLNPHVLKPPGLLAGGGIRIQAVTR